MSENKFEPRSLIDVDTKIKIEYLKYKYKIALINFYSDYPLLIEGFEEFKRKKEFIV